MRYCLQFVMILTRLFSFLSLALEHLPCRDAAYDAPALRNVQADVYS